MHNAARIFFLILHADNELLGKRQYSNN